MKNFLLLLPHKWGGISLTIGLLCTCLPGPGCREAGTFCVRPCPHFVSLTLPVSHDLETSSASWNYGDNSVLQPLLFDIRDYPEASQLRLKAEMKSEDPNVRCYVQLYNLTDERAFKYATLDNQYGHIDTSQNLISQFPQREIKLVVRIRSGQEGSRVFSGPENVLVIE